MHATSFLILAFCAAASLAAPSPRDHALERRQLQAIPVVGSIVSIGLGAAAIHKNHNNQESFALITDEVHSLEARVAEMKVLSQRLVRRQIGTITGAVTISRSKKLRKSMDAMDEALDMLEHDVHALMDHEGVRDEDQHLQRRQLGLILTPIATKKNSNDRKRLMTMQDRVTHIHMNVDRVSAAQNAHLARLGRSGSMALAGGGVMANGNSRFLSNNGVLADNASRSFSGGRVSVRVTTSSSPQYHHE